MIESMPLEPLPTRIQTRRGPVEGVVTGEGPAILALHGALGGFDQGLILLRAAGVEAGHRGIALSRPGYLGTPLEVAPTPEAQADLYAAILDTLGMADAMVFAVSGGGPSALHFALRHPRRCRGLVLISACTGPLTARLPLAYHLIKLLGRSPALLRAMQRSTARQPARAARRAIPDRAMRERTCGHPVAGPLLLALQLSVVDRLLLRTPGTENDVAQFRAMPPLPLARIRVPVLVVHGMRDPVVPIADGLAVAEAVRGAERLLIEDGGHVCLFTHLDEIRGCVRGFLARHGLPPTLTAGVN